MLERATSPWLRHGQSPAYACMKAHAKNYVALQSLNGPVGAIQPPTLRLLSLDGVGVRRGGMPALGK